MEINAEKTKLMTNSAIGIQREIYVKRTEAWNSDKFQVHGDSCILEQNRRFSQGLHKPLLN